LNIPFKPQLSNLPRLAMKPRPASRPTPTFTSYTQSKQRLSKPNAVRPNRTLNKVPVKQLQVSRIVPDVPEPRNVTIKPKRTLSTRQKRKLPRDDGEYRPKLKKRRIRKTTLTQTVENTKKEEPNFNWRNKDKIQVPDIFETSPEDWPLTDDEDEGKVETLADVTNQAYYVRHFRAEQRERIFYQKLQKWRDKEAAQDKNADKLRVVARPRGPWQVKLPKSINRGLQHIPPDILAQPKYNYVPQEKWEQPVVLIRRIVKKEEEGPITRTRAGKDLNYLGGLTFTRYR